ncbi:MAG TPA: secondary thiamine-phosphate synthase enzyme YjbQ [Anaerolineae bacterium]|nr:secondary thiamine-phosphate synthase enzyme YjbQ [Anaerolineae bacterium]
MVVSRHLQVSTRGSGDVIDITRDVAGQLDDSGVRNGVVTVFVAGSTSALTTLEFEAGVVADLRQLMDRIVPPDADYKHNLRWGDGNGHAHIRHALLGPSLTIPLVDGRLTLGTWQQIVLLDFDCRPRTRSVVVQVMGE